jgi:hypothetical protein
MKLILKMAAALTLVSVIGCNQDDKQAKPSDTGVLKTQLETLDQAKQVEQVVQDAAEQQRQKVEEGTQ